MLYNAKCSENWVCSISFPIFLCQDPSQLNGNSGLSGAVSFEWLVLRGTGHTSVALPETSIFKNEQESISVMLSGRLPSTK